MDKDAGPGTGHIKFPLQRHVLPIAGKAVLREAGQTDQTHHSADHVYRDQKHMARHSEAVLQITQPLDPQIVIAVEAVDLPGILSRVEQIQRRQGDGAQSDGKKLPAAEVDGDGAELMDQQGQGQHHISDGPDPGETVQGRLDPGGDGHQPAVQVGEVEHQRDDGANQHQPPCPRVLVHQGGHGVGHGQLQQAQGEQVPPQGQQISRLIQGDELVLQPDAHTRREEEEPFHFRSDTAPLGDDDHDAHEKQHQGKAGGGQEQGLPVFLHNEHGKTAHQQPRHQYDEHGVHPFPAIGLKSILAGMEEFVNQK